MLREFYNTKILCIELPFLLQLTRSNRFVFVLGVSGCNIQELTPGSEMISQLIMDGSRTLLNGSKLTSRLHLENVLLKLLLLVFIHILIKKGTSLELQLLATALFHWEFAIGTISPTPSYSLQSSVHNITPSLSSFQSTIANDRLARTLNASIAASKGGLSEFTSQTAGFQINMPVTNTKLAHLQGKIRSSKY